MSATNKPGASSVDTETPVAGLPSPALPATDGNASAEGAAEPAAKPALPGTFDVVIRGTFNGAMLTKDNAPLAELLVYLGRLLAVLALPTEDQTAPVTFTSMETRTGSWVAGVPVPKAFTLMPGAWALEPPPDGAWEQTVEYDLLGEAESDLASRVDGLEAEVVDDAGVVTRCAHFSTRRNNPVAKELPTIAYTQARVRVVGVSCTDKTGKWKVKLRSASQPEPFKVAVSDVDARRFAAFMARDCQVDISFSAVLTPDGDISKGFDVKEADAVLGHEESLVAARAFFKAATAPFIGAVNIHEAIGRHKS